MAGMKKFNPRNKPQTYTKSGVAELGRKLGVSRQRAWQILKKEQNKCVICGKPLVSSDYCLKHAIKKTAQQRKRLGFKPYRPGRRGRPTEFSKSRHSSRE